MNTKQIEAAMAEVWRQATRLPQPDLVVVDPMTGEMYRRVSEEAKRAREVFSPVGLRRLFPGLRAVT